MKITTIKNIEVDAYTNLSEAGVDSIEAFDTDEAIAQLKDEIAHATEENHPEDIIMAWEDLLARAQSAKINGFHYIIFE
jgi:hypothetical protein